MTRALHYKRRHPCGSGIAPPKCSPIWRGVLSTSAPFLSSLAFKLGDGKSCSFWHSRWAGEVVLRHRFPSLFLASPLKHISVEGWFRRLGTLPNLGLPWVFHDGGDDICPFRDLASLFQPNASPDAPVWRWDPRSNFSPGSAYRFLVFDGVVDIGVKHLWNIRIPLKVKVFLWLATRNRILTADNLAKRGWIGPSICCLCGRAPETLCHLMFLCPFARGAWLWNLSSEPNVLSAIFNTNAGIAIRWNRARLLVRGCRRKLLDLCIAATCCEVWLARNNCIFRDKLVRGSECGVVIEQTVRQWIAAYNS